MFQKYTTHNALAEEQRLKRRQRRWTVSECCDWLCCSISVCSILHTIFTTNEIRNTQWLAMMNRVYPNDRTEFVVCFAERARNPLRSDGRQGMINDILLFVCGCACVCPPHFSSLFLLFTFCWCFCCCCCFERCYSCCWILHIFCYCWLVVNIEWTYYINSISIAFYSY